MVEIEFLKTPQQREIQTITITEDYISNQPFFIKSNQVKKFYMKYDPLPDDISLISIMPHMHLRGKDYEIRLIFPTGETQTAFKGKWDFNWQQLHFYEQPVNVTFAALSAASAASKSAQRPLHSIMPIAC